MAATARSIGRVSLDEDSVERSLQMLERYEPALRRVATRICRCPDDAEDAYQRGVEILLRRAPADAGPERLARWMRVVVRREALHVLGQRGRSLHGAGGALEPPDLVPCERAGPLEALESRDRIAAAATALSQLKPQERRALALFAAGCSYAEIQSITGWTYTKVNRCMAEGRARLALAPGVA